MRYTSVVALGFFTIAPTLVVLAQDAEQADTGLIASFLTDNLSGAGRQVNIYGFSGALSSKATIDKITIADDEGIWLTAEGLVLDWNRAALLTGRIEVSDLSAARIEVTRVPQTEAQAPSTTTTPFALPDLPVSVDVSHMAIAELALGAPILGDAIALTIDGSAKLAGGDGTANLSATRIDGDQGTFAIDGSYSNDSREMGLNLTLSEGPDGIAARLIDLPGRPSVDLAIAGTGPIDSYSATLTLATDGQQRLAGGLTLITTPADTAEGTPTKGFELDVGGDVTALFLPEYRDFFGPDVKLAAKGQRDDTGRLDLSALTLSTQSLRLDGTLQIGADGWPERFALTGDIADASGAAVTLPLAGPVTQVQTAQMDIAFDAAQGSAWTADITATGFNRPGLGLPDLTLSGGGTIDRATGSVNARLSYAASGITLGNAGMSEALGDRLGGDISVDYTSGGRVNLSQFTLSGAGIDGQLSALITGFGGEVAIAPKLRLSVSGLDRFDTLAGLPGLAGDANMTLYGRVLPLSGAADLALVAKTADLEIGQDEVDALIAGAGSLALTVNRNENGTFLRNLSMTTQSTTLTGDVALGADTMTGALAVQTLADGLIPGATGVLAATIDAAQDAEGLLTAEADITRDGDVISLALALPTTGAGTIGGTLSLTDLAQFSGLAGQQLSGALDAQINGTMTRDATELAINLTATGDDLGTGIEAVDTLLAGQGSLSGQISRSGSTFAVRGLNLAFPNVTLSGDFSQSDTGRSASMSGRLANIGLFAPDFSGPLSVNVNATADPAGTWTVDADATGPSGTTATVGGSVAATGQSDLDLRGAIPLALLNGVLDPRRLGGTAQFDLGLNGTPSLSALSGTISTTGASLSAPTLGQSLTDIGGTVRLNGGRATIDLTGQATAGGGVALSGPVTLSGRYPAELVATLSNLTLRDPVLYETTASGAIAITGGLSGGAAISGTITLGPTEVRVPSSTVSSLGDLPDVTHLSTPAAVAATLSRAGLTTSGTSAEGSSASGPAYPLDLTINAPSRVFIRGRGLDAELGGSLRLTGTSANVIPSGEFNLVRGRLDILQQRFDLTEGSASLQGQFDPVLRLVATTQSETGTSISVVIDGSASDPQVSFESSPDLPQDEVLSQLIFGRDLSQISALQAVQLAAAVGTLAGRGGGGIVDKIRLTAGLDDLDVTSDDAGNAAVRAGKYLTENIYTDVTVSSSGTADVNLNLDLTDSITAKGSLGADGTSGLGVFFEKDY